MMFLNALFLIGSFLTFAKSTPEDNEIFTRPCIHPVKYIKGLPVKSARMIAGMEYTYVVDILNVCPYEVKNIELTDIGITPNIRLIQKSPDFIKKHNLLPNQHKTMEFTISPLQPGKYLDSTLQFRWVNKDGQKYVTHSNILNPIKIIPADAIDSETIGFPRFLAFIVIHTIPSLYCLWKIRTIIRN